MPIYEYECQKCHREFEELVFGRDPEIHCPDCNSDEVKRLLSVTAFKSGDTFVSSASSGHSCGGCHGGSCSTCK